MTEYQADLHIHTLLSPCAEIEMIPSLIIEAAKIAGLDLIGIADHNSCENVASVVEAAKSSGIKVLPGMEVQTVEGVHLLCLFDEVEQAGQMQEAVYEALPPLPSPPLKREGEGRSHPGPLLRGEGDRVRKVFEQQMVVDGNDEFVRYCERLLSMPSALDIDEVFERAEGLGGIVIPSHIDRSGTGICGVLGMLPETPGFEAVEVSANLTTDQARAKYASIGNLPVFHASDAHWLSAIGEHRTALTMGHRSVAEIRLACRGEGGRRISDA